MSHEARRFTRRRLLQMSAGASALAAASPEAAAQAPTDDLPPASAPCSP